MKTFRHILGVLVLVSYSFLSQGQSISSITLSSICDDGNTITIQVVGTEIAGNNANNTALELNGVDISNNITTFINSGGVVNDTIAATLPSNTIAGVQSITVGKDGNTNQGTDTESFSLYNPQVTISATNSSVCTGEVPTIKFNVSGTISEFSTITYTINGGTHTVNASGDGEITVPLSTITASTTYQIVSISCPNISCSNTISGQSVTVGVIPFPTATLSITGSSSICNGSSTTLKFDISNKSTADAPIEIVYYEGVTSNTMVVFGTDTTITVSPTSTTNYILSTVTDTSFSCSQTASGIETVTVNVIPSGTLTITDTTLCEGDAVNLVFNVSNPNNDLLEIIYKKNGTSNSISTSGTVYSISETPNETSIYQLISVENTVTNCINTINATPISVEVSKIPTASLTNTGSSAICNGDNTTLKFDIGNKNTASAAVEVTYFEGATSNTITIYGADTTITVSPSSTTTYILSNVNDVASSCGQSISDVETVTVSAIPTGTLTASTTNLCNGEVVDLVFNFSNPNGDAMKISYEKNGSTQTINTSGTSYTLNETLNTTTTYQLISIENTTTSCIDSVNAAPIIVSVSNTPTASLSIAGSSTICAGGQTALTFSISNKTNQNDIVSISYYAGSTLETITVSGADTTITVSPNMSTSYTLIAVEDVLSGCTNSATSSVIVTVTGVISGTFSVSDNSICSGESIYLFFGANNPNGDDIVFYYSDDTASYSVATTSNFTSILVNNLSTTTTYRLDSIENSTSGCLTPVLNSTEIVTVSSMMGASISTNPTSVCEGENYTIDLSITGRSIGDSVTIQFTKSNGANINTPIIKGTASTNNISIAGSDNITTQYNLASITNNTTGCTTTFSPDTSSSAQILITSSINYSISTSKSVICEGEGTDLIFSVDNPNGQVITIYYSDSSANSVGLDSIVTTSTTATVTVSPTENTKYTAETVKTSTCEYSLAGKFAEVVVNKVPSVSITGGGTACNGSSVPLQFNFSNKSNPTDSVTVQFLDEGVLQSLSTTGYSITTIVTPPSTTVYPLISVTNNTVGCANNSISGSATVTVGSGLLGDIQISDNEICLGESIDLSLIINGLSGSTEVVYYDGSVLDTVIATSSTTTITKNPAGVSATYTLISLKDINTGCPGSVGTSSSQTLSINSLPSVLTSIFGNAAVCENELIGLNFDFSNGTPPYSVGYQESIITGGVTNLGLTTPTDTTIYLSPSDDAIYTVSNIVDSKGCASLPNLDSVNATINLLPSATLSLDTNIVCRGTPTNLNFSVQNNENLDVWVKYSSLNTTMSAPLIDSVLTSSSISLPVTPNRTTTYRIVEIRNAVTGCISPVSNINLPQILNVYQLPTVTATVDAFSDSICNGSNTTIAFDFPAGTPPLTVYYADSFSNVATRIDTGQAWNNLATGASVIEPQSNSASTQVTHTYIVTRVVDGVGCATDYLPPNEPTTKVEILPNPNIALSGVQPVSQPYASTDQTAYSIQGTPQGGPLYSGFFGAGLGLTQYPANQSVATTSFIPANVGFSPTDTVIDVLLYYEYEDIVTGCSGLAVDTARIKKALEYDFYNEGSNELDTIYCRNADSTYIFAKITASDTVNIIGNNTFVLGNNNGKVFSNVQSFGDSIRVTFTPLDSTGVFPLRFGSVEDGFTVITLAVIDTVNTTFSPNVDNVYFCQSPTERISLTGIPNLNVSDTNGVFTSPTLGIIDQDINTSSADGWYLRRDISGLHKVTYTYIDGVTGCVTQKTQNVDISSAPITYFQSDIDCNTKTVTFVDSSTVIQSVVGLDSLVQWEWSLGDGREVDTTENITLIHTYNNSDAFTVSLNVTSAKGCSSTFDTTFIIGTIPEISYDWIFATLGDMTTFTNTSPSIPNIGSVPNYIDSLYWDFGDGTVLLGDTITNVDTVTHQYAAIGNYESVLYASTNNGCSDSISTNVYILPKIVVTDFPYYERFDDANSNGGGWIADPNIVGNFWVWGHPNGTHIQHSDPLNNAWFTDLEPSYTDVMDAWVYSPTFDFTTLEKPMVAFRYWVDSRVSDGAIIQYTDDSGISWNALGGLGSGLSWYDVDNLVSQPGEQSGFDGLGWTGDDASEGWQVARHKLDELKGKPKVRFRIAFSVAPGSLAGYDGFAFDDFWVGERQKRVLVESFTHVNNTSYSQVQDSIYSRIDDNNLDFVLVEYHNEIPNTGVPSSDDFNLFNPADPSARLLYYQYSETDKMAVDGEVRATRNGVNLSWAQNDMDLVILEDPTFNVSIDQFTINGNTIDVATTIKARKPMPARLRKVYIAVVEDDLLLAGSSINHKSVLRKLLPSAAGESLTNAWSIGTSQSVTTSWNFSSSSSPINTGNLKVVVWIQSNQTQKVYQVASSALPNIPYDSTVVNTKPLDITKEEAFRLFPNPNNGNFTIQFEAPTHHEMQWQLIDINGRTVQEDNVPAFTQSVFINTDNLIKGVYFFRLFNQDGIASVRKIIIK